MARKNDGAAPVPLAARHTSWSEEQQKTKQIKGSIGCEEFINLLLVRQAAMPVFACRSVNLMEK